MLGDRRLDQLDQLRQLDQAGEQLDQLRQLGEQLDRSIRRSNQVEELQALMCLSHVASITQRLPVGSIPEDSKVAAVWSDVIDLLRRLATTAARMIEKESLRRGSPGVVIWSVRPLRVWHFRRLAETLESERTLRHTSGMPQREK